MSTTLTRTISVPGDQETVFDYIADFSNAAEWDPGVVAGKRHDDGSTGVGAKFDITVDFKGRKMETVYELTEYDRPNRVVFVGGTGSFQSTDEISVTPSTDGHLRIDYVAVFEMSGIISLAEPLLKGSFNRLADDAVAGLEKTLTP